MVEGPNRWLVEPTFPPHDAAASLGRLCKGKRFCLGTKNKTDREFPGPRSKPQVSLDIADAFIDGATKMGEARRDILLEIGRCEGRDAPAKGEKAGGVQI